MLYTVNYPQFNIQLQFDHQRNVVGYANLGEVWCCDWSIKDHSEKLQKLADEHNDGNIGKVLNYDSYGKTEWYAAPALKVFWSRKWE
jgi:hypothetical protein